MFDDGDELFDLPRAPRSREPVDLVVKLRAQTMRLDHYLAGNFTEYSRSEIQRAIEAGAVTVNDKPTKPGYKVRCGDRVRILLPEPTHDLPQPEDIPLEILYEDEVLALINKPPIWSCIQPRATGRARWSTPCNSTSTISARSTASFGQASCIGWTAIPPG
jgi:23S rRNA-/tRNA-specific pseudouridylate synthase